jgi:hypothetical protein
MHNNTISCDNYCKIMLIAQGGLNLQQTAAANSELQASLSIDAVSGGDLARFETGLRSMAEQLSQIEDRVSEMHRVSHACNHRLIYDATVHVHNKRAYTIIIIMV